MNLKGTNWIVTGGSSGIGKAIASTLTDEGAQVMITGRNKEKLMIAAEVIGAIPIWADVSTDDGIGQVYNQVETQWNNKLDGLINNAGIGVFKPIDTCDRSDFETVFQTNVFGVAMMSKQAAILFKNQQQGNIVNIASTASLKGFAQGSIYASSKFALRGLTQCLQAELRPYNVRVFGINPSEVTTAFNQESRTERSVEDNKLRAQEIAHTIIFALKMDNRGFVPELSIWATNPF
jgi:3-oxoacyl-[acyl-carrier protein] reductase